MAYIYKITNTINGKLYIGQTSASIEERWKEHIKNARRENIQNRPLYKAINKYGLDNFKIDIIEEIPNEDIVSREKYWIEYYGTFKHGYNATIGGDGVPYIDYDLVIATYYQTANQNETARQLNIGADSVRRILKIKQINNIPSAQTVSKNYNGNIINMYDLQNNFIKTFASARDAAFAVTNKKDCSHIMDVCKGKRKTAYGYIWKFANNSRGPIVEVV